MNSMRSAPKRSVKCYCDRLSVLFYIFHAAIRCGCKALNKHTHDGLQGFFFNARLLLLRWCTIVICRCCCFVTMSAAQRSTTDAVDQELQPSKTKPNAKHKINIWRWKNERNSDGKQDPNVCVFFFHTPSLCYSFLYYRFALQHGKDAKSFAYCFGFWLILAFGEQNDATSPAWRHVVLRAKFKYEVFFFLHSNNNENNLFEWNENAH